MYALAEWSHLWAVDGRSSVFFFVMQRDSSSITVYLLPLPLTSSLQMKFTSQPKMKICAAYPLLCMQMCNSNKNQNTNICLWSIACAHFKMFWDDLLFHLSIYIEGKKKQTANFGHVLFITSLNFAMSWNARHYIWSTLQGTSIVFFRSNLFGLRFRFFAVCYTFLAWMIKVCVQASLRFSMCNV